MTRLRWIEAGALVLAALFALGFHLTLPSRLPKDESYQEVAAVLAKEAQPGDVVLLQPWWTERARVFLPENVPVVGYLDGEGDPLDSHPRIWVLAQPSLPLARMGRFESRFSPRRERIGEPRHFGNLELTLYRNGLYRPVRFSGVDAVAQAHVYVEQPDGSRADCQWDGRQHRCPGGLHVAAEWHEILYQPRRCLWMHPPGGQARLVAEFPSVPEGPIRVEAGLVWEHAWKHEPQKTPVQVQLEGPNGAPLAAIEIPLGKEGLFQAEGQLAQPSPVRVWTQSMNGEERDVCVDVTSLGPAPTGAM